MSTSLEDTLQSRKMLEDEVSDLKDELVLTTGDYFERRREQVFFFYPHLDLIGPL